MGADALAKFGGQAASFVFFVYGITLFLVSQLVVDDARGAKYDKVLCKTFI